MCVGWTCRWVVIMPRFPSPVAPPGTERVVRTLMVTYKGRDQCVPICKVWLDGAGELLLSASRCIVCLIHPRHMYRLRLLSHELSIMKCTSFQGLHGRSAVARTVLGYKGSSLTQCALVLHRLHAPPSGAHITGDQCKPPQIEAITMLACLISACFYFHHCLVELRQLDDVKRAVGISRGCCC